MTFVSAPSLILMICFFASREVFHKEAAGENDFLGISSFCQVIVFVDLFWFLFGKQARGETKKMVFPVLEQK